MAVRKQDTLDADTEPIDRSEDTAGFSAGINNEALFGRIIPQDGAVLLEWRDRDDGATELMHGGQGPVLVSRPQTGGQIGDGDGIKPAAGRDRSAEAGPCAGPGLDQAPYEVRQPPG